MDLDLEHLTLTEIIQLQNRIAETVQRRFERRIAVAFTDIVASTEYFARHGDQAGKRRQQECVDLVVAAATSHGGRLVDTAGDGTFTWFPTAERGVAAMVDVQNEISRRNLARASEQQVQVRIGVHYGPVLTDGVVVTGDGVNLCARVAASASGGEIRLTRAAFVELPHTERLRCRVLPSTPLKGIADAVEMLRLEWRDPMRFPTLVRIDETGQMISLPDRDTITFGRLDTQEDGTPGNDVVLRHPDKTLTQKISRFQFELRRGGDGFVLRAISPKNVEVDGQAARQGEDVAIRPGSVVRIAGVLTLRFLSEAGGKTLVTVDRPEQ